MEDRKASWVAAMLGTTAIGCFWLARPLPHVGVLSILSQKNAPLSRAGPDRDAAVVFQIGESKAEREAVEEGKRIEYRLQGSTGQSYPLVPMEGRTDGSFKLQMGYAHGIRHPRLAMIVDDRPLAWANVDDVPEPREESLRASGDAPFRLLNRGGHGVQIEPKRSLGSGERWWLTARRTTYASNVEAEASLPTRLRGPDQSELPIPFPEATKAVEVDLVRERLQRSEATLQIPDLRLVRTPDGATLVVDKDRLIPNRLGATIVLPHQISGPHYAPRRRSPFLGEATLLVSPPDGDQSDKATPDGHRSALGYRLEILSPSPESLGLLSLRIGAGIRQAVSRPGPLRTGRFAATVRISFLKLVPVDRRRVVATVEKAAPLPLGRGRTPFYDGPRGAHGAGPWPFDGKVVAEVEPPRH